MFNGIESFVKMRKILEKNGFKLHPVPLCDIQEKPVVRLSEPKILRFHLLQRGNGK